MRTIIKNRIIKGRKGSVTVEAAVFMPVFILAVVSFLYVMKFAIAVDGMAAAGYEYGRELARDMYAEQGTVLRSLALAEKTEAENERLCDVRISPAYPRYLSAGVDNVKAVSMSYKVKLPAPTLLEDKLSAKHTFVFRPFVGKDNSSAQRQDPEENKAYEAVWVFPRSGERYHLKDCPYIEVMARQGLLSAGIRSKYAPCTLCKASELRNGDVTYYFPRAGESFHKAECALVDRYVIEMDKADAAAKGYTACSKCTP